MGKAVKSASGTLSKFGSSALSGPMSMVSGITDTLVGPGPQIAGIRDPGAFDLSEEGKAADAEARAQYQAAERRSRGASKSQSGLIKQLEGQIAGTAPSLAEAQLRSASNRSLAQQLAASAASRGSNPAAQARQLMQQQASTGRDLAEASAVARLAGQQGAQQQLGGLLQSEQALADKLVQDYMQRGFDYQTADKQARQQLELARFNAQNQANVEGFKGKQAVTGALLEGGGKAGAAALSDKNEKKNIKSAKKEVNSFLDALSAREYEYKQASAPGAAKGPRVGILAQDLEKSKMGKTLVKNTPQGKMVDVEQGYGAILAAQAQLNERLKQLEKKSSKKKA